MGGRGPAEALVPRSTDRLRTGKVGLAKYPESLTIEVLQFRCTIQYCTQ